MSPNGTIAGTQVRKFGDEVANFLKDRQLFNVSLTTQSVADLSHAIDEFAAEMNVGIAPGDALAAIPSYIIRYDEGQGDRVFVSEFLLKKYRKAEVVERVVFTLDTPESLRSNRAVGAFIEVVFDSKNPNCFLTVSSDDEGWVDGKFARLSLQVQKLKNLNGIVRNAASDLLIQMMGVVICFLISLAVARKLSKLVLVENSFMLSFIFAFMLTANLWGYIQRQVVAYIAFIFPNISFIRDGRQYLHWISQAIVGAIIVYLLGLIFDRSIALFLSLSKGIFIAE